MKYKRRAGWAAFPIGAFSSPRLTTMLQSTNGGQGRLLFRFAGPSSRDPGRNPQIAAAAACSVVSSVYFSSISDRRFLLSSPSSSRVLQLQVLPLLRLVPSPLPAPSPIVAVSTLSAVSNCRRLLSHSQPAARPKPPIAAISPVSNLSSPLSLQGCNHCW
ncbi:hypothetical protein ACLOJK_028402 [Asimina triloba]